MFLKPRQKVGGRMSIGRGTADPDCLFPVLVTCHFLLPAGPSSWGWRSGKGVKCFRLTYPSCVGSLWKGDPPPTVLGIVTHTARARCVATPTGHP